MNTGHYHPEVSVSVIIPAFRAANTISRSLLSVGKQTRLPAEVIVIDDGSDDETVNVVTDLKRRFFNDNLKVIKQQTTHPQYTVFFDS